jgi:uncharacterized protein involved in exopolysaccharide biosynthesis
VQRFLQANRAFASDPQLQFEHDRLQRELLLRNAVYTTVRQSLEQARIEVSRDTPTITVVQQALPPLVANNKLLPIKILLGLILGSMFGLGFGIVREFMARGKREGGNAFEEFTMLREAAREDVSRIWSLLRRRFARR